MTTEMGMQESSGAVQKDLMAFYDDYWRTGNRPAIPAPPPAVLRLMQRSIPAGAACLDIGCGNGRAGGLPLTAMGCRYIGVDLSPAAVASARSLGVDARQIADAGELPFADESFDVVLAMEVLEHLMLPERALAEARRVLKPQGLMIVTTPNVAYWRRRLELMVGRWNPFGYPDAVSRPWADPHIRFFTAAALRHLLLAAGFVQVQVHGHGGMFLGDIPGLGRRFRRAEGSPAYRRLETRFPSPFGCFLNARAFKPR